VKASAARLAIDRLEARLRELEDQNARYRACLESLVAWFQRVEANAEGLRRVKAAEELLKLEGPAGGAPGPAAGAGGAA